jgi:proteasome accessory factor C
VTAAATDRLSRLLALVPYLVSRQGIPLAEAAAQFDISQAQLVKDLELLFVCGTPGHLPDDLIDVDWDDGHVFLTNADPIARPLRLDVDEALALLVGLRALTDVPGLHDRDALQRTLLKLEAAAGASAAASSQVRVEVEAQGPLAEVRRALAEGRRVHLSYFVPARDETTERDVDPMRVLLVDDRWYLEGWCRRAEDVRLFRLDRIQTLELLDVDGTPPPQAQPRDVNEALFTPGEEDLEVVVETDRAGAWIVDYYPVDRVEDLGEGRRRVTLHVSDPALVRRLAWRMGGHVRVVSPVDLQQSVAAGAQEALSAYTAVPSGVET